MHLTGSSEFPLISIMPGILKLSWKHAEDVLLEFAQTTAVLLITFDDCKCLEEIKRRARNIQKIQPFKTKLDSLKHMMGNQLKNIYSMLILCDLQKKKKT